MLASRSAMPSLNSANAGSSASSGKLEPLPCAPPEVVSGVVVLARREVREGARKGVVGREGGARRVREVLRAREGGDRGVVEAIAVSCVDGCGARLGSGNNYWGRRVRSAPSISPRVIS